VLAKTESSGMIATRSKSISSIDDVYKSIGGSYPFLFARDSTQQSSALNEKREEKKRLFCNS
jgi:hypothetical protein